MKNFSLPIKKDKGVALLVAVIVASIVLTIGLTLSVVVTREYVFSTSIRESQIAFYTAEAGSQCARYWLSKSRTHFMDENRVLCNDQNINIDQAGGEYNFSYSLQGYPYVSEVNIATNVHNDLQVFAQGYNRNPNDDLINTYQRFVGTEFSSACFGAVDAGAGPGDPVVVNTTNYPTKNLQTLLNGQGFGSIDVQNHQKNYQTWSVNPATFAILEVISLSAADQAQFHNAFGWYVDGKATESDIVRVGRTQSIPTGDFSELPTLNQITGESRKFIVPDANDLGFVLFRKVSGGNLVILATEDRLNPPSPGGAKNAVVYDVPANQGGGYIIGFEDQLATSPAYDQDYDDVVLLIRVISCSTTPIIK